MRLIVDTHAAIWFGDADVRLSSTARDSLFDAANTILLSAVVPWEISIKRALGKLAATDGYLELLVAGAHELPVTVAHAQGVERLPHHHADPFDRLLVAQAQAENAAIVTNDEQIRRYDVPIVW